MNGRDTAKDWLCLFTRDKRKTPCLPALLGGQPLDGIVRVLDMNRIIRENGVEQIYEPG